MRIRITVLAAASVMIATTPSFATQQRSFVASNGNDANACTLVAPCRSFGTAITTTSPNGEIIVLNSAGYGPVTITKSVSIIAPQGVYAGITVASGDGITVNFNGAIVALRGLSINGQGGAIGINIQSATRVHIEGCVISNMGSNGILQTAPFAELSVLDTIVRDNAGTGIGIAADASVVIDHVRSEHNGFDGFYIVGATTAGARAAITDSIFARNGVNGINIDSVPGAELEVVTERSTLSENHANGLIAQGTGHGEVTVARSTFIYNLDAQISVIHNSGGDMIVMINENSFTMTANLGIRADGAYARVYASANSMAAKIETQFVQMNGAEFVSFGNNIGPFWANFGTITPGTGFSH